MDLVYRLRSTKALLSGFHELEEQEIFLSPPERLNDPMEGYKDVFWDGDEVLWRNLLAHYLLSLLCATIDCSLTQDDTFEEPEIRATLSERELPSDKAREIYREVRRRFFADSAAQEMPRILSSLGVPLRAHGLRLVLETLHYVACKAVTDELAQRGMIPPNGLEALPSTNVSGDLFEKLSADILDPTERGKVLEVLGFAALQTSDRQVLRMYRALPAGASAGLLRKNIFILVDFPRRYVDAVGDGLTHFKWYTACFTATCENASMWSSYGDEHRGAALMFKTKADANGAPTLTLSMVTGMSSSTSSPTGVPSRSAHEARLHQVIYSSKAPVLDFFKYMGVLPRGQIERQWYTDQEGVVSPLLQQRYSDLTAWRTRYWESTVNVARTKLEDWKHEQEYRLIVNDVLGFRSEFPKAKFDFSQLAGIVFGMRTPLEDRLAIIEVVNAKCKRDQRDDFVFKQMVYLPTEGRLAVI